MNIETTPAAEEILTAEERIRKAIAPLLDLREIIDGEFKSGEDPSFSLLGIVRREIGLVIAKLDPKVMGY